MGGERDEALEADGLRYRELIDMLEGEFPQFREQLDAAVARAERAEAEGAALRAALILAREELNGLPRSLGYDFTHLPKIDAALGMEGAG